MWRDEHRCQQQLPGCQRFASCVDHIKPVRTHPHLRLRPDNLQTSCRHCNLVKARREGQRLPPLARLVPDHRRRADDGAVTGVMGHANIAITRRLYAADWREADERNEIVLRQFANAGVGQ